MYMLFMYLQVIAFQRQAKESAKVRKKKKSEIFHLPNELILIFCFSRFVPKGAFVRPRVL